MPKPIFRIFVSSTFEDLKAYRKSAEDAINELEQKFIGMEYLGAMDSEPITASLDMVEQCDLFVGIYAWRYGYVPDNSECSITEQEYRLAEQLRRPRLCYLIESKFPWMPEFIERGEATEKLERFKNSIEKDLVRDKFREPHDLKIKLMRDISKWLLSHRPDLEKESPVAGGDEPAKQYRKAIADKYTTLAMLGFKRTFNMDNIYIPITVHLDQECRKIGRQDEGIDKIFPHSLKAEDLLDFPEKVSIVLGEPGMGKTTMMQYLARRESNTPDGLLLIFMKLAEFSKTRDNLETALLATVENHISGYAIRNYTKNAFSTGKTLILLDGLDEVRHDEYISVTERIRAFISAHKECRIIVTSRKAGFQSHELPYRLFEIDRLPIAEIKNFVHKWFGHQSDLGKQLMTCIERNERIHDLAKNPFLLSIICLIYEQDEGLPDRRVELYEKSTITLLTLFDEKQVPKVNVFTRQLKERVLEDLAYHFFCQGIDELPYDPIINQVSQTLTTLGRNENEESILREIRENSGLLQQSGDHHLFVHRTFYEYYVARKMRSDSQEIILERTKDPRWEEPIRLYAAQILPTEDGKKAGTQFLKQLWEKDRALALRCYPDMAQVVEAQLIKDLLRQASVEERVELVKGLPDKIADPEKLIETLRELFRWETNGEVLYWGVQILEENGTPEALKIVYQKLDNDADERYRKYIEKDMKAIPSGKFKMGSDEYDDERPVHEVYLDEFRISCFLITNRLYEIFDPDHRSQRDEVSDLDNQPVINVNWYEAVIFSRWLGCRLPTEAEWEKAAQGGKNFEYATRNGELSPKLANCFDKIGKTTPVDKYPPNPYGLHDMSGNVDEWCHDWYDEDYYRKSPKNNPLGADKGEYRVLRGGSWGGSIAGYFRCAYRIINQPVSRYSYVGFRVVCSAQF